MKILIKYSLLLVICLTLLGLLYRVTGANAQEPDENVGGQAQASSEFTYQGRLTDGETPASGDYDFRFKLYTAMTGGSQIGTPFEVGNVTVADGFFTVVLNFGSGIFNGEARYLEIEVKEAGGPNYTMLSPRQPLTAVPYALYALSGNGSDTLANLACTADQIVVWNGSAWVCGSNGGASHNHLGQTWTGTNPLQIGGSYSDAPLVLSNNTKQGLSITSAGTTGVLINKAGNPSTTTASPSNNGFEVQGAEGHGLQVGQSDLDGVHVTKSNSDGVQIERADSSGLRVDSSGGPGLLINQAGNQGVRINEAGNPSKTNFSFQADGIGINGAEGNGVYVGHSDLSGILVKSAAEDGITIDNAGLNGVFVNKAAGVGLGVSDATGSGLYIGKTGASGIYIDDAGGNGISINDAGGDGIKINGATGNGVDVTTSGGNATIYSENTGSGFALGAVNNSSTPTVYAENNGSGIGLAVDTGSGIGVDISTGSSNAVNATNNSSFATVYAENNGSGDGVYITTGSGNAVDAANIGSASTIYARNFGSGDGLSVVSGSGNGIDVDTGSSNAVNATNNSSFATIYAQNNGSGDTEAIAAVVSSSGGEAIQATNSDTGAVSNIIIGCSPSCGTDIQFKVESDGDVKIDGSFIDTGADYADLMPVAGQKADYNPGDVLVVGPAGKMSLASEPNAANVAGVYSTKPAFVGGYPSTGWGVEYDELDLVPVALVGMVPTKVSAENGTIQPGDLLTTSTTPGHAMKATPIALEGIELYRPGTIIGKALEPLTEDTGIIKVLVTLQ